MKPKVVITFDPDSGNPSIEAQGVAGPACKGLTKAFEKALGTVISDTNTADYHKAPLMGQKEANRATH